jgi:hypothetical protein
VGPETAAAPTTTAVLGRTLATHRVVDRTARLERGTTLAFADLHNHTHLSDGIGRPDHAFQRMRDAGLDVAALTDHARIGWGRPGAETCDDDGHPCRPLRGLDEDAWAMVGRVADLANADGTFVAIRGFEWTSPTLGHVNVWGSARWTDALSTEAFSPADWRAPWSAERLAQVPAACLDGLSRSVEPNWVEEPRMEPFYRWLAGPPARSPRAPGGLASFNHPGRDGMTFEGFRHSVEAAERIVALEIFNRDEEYLFEGVDRGEVSPLVACLDAGWRAGLLGVTDEHDALWGSQEGLGRTGLWVWERTRAGVREALRARRFYATRVSGLRLDATADGVRMGGFVGRREGRTRVRLELDRGPAWIGKPLSVQALGPGTPLPTVVDVVEICVPGGGRDVTFDLPPIEAWLVLRVSDPELPADTRAPVSWGSFGGAIAYASPFFAAG